jgi:hypothetical protein
VFTSKDNFHAHIVPLFLDSHQTFVNGIDFKEDLKKLDAYYSAMPEEDIAPSGQILVPQARNEETGVIGRRTCKIDEARLEDLKRLKKSQPTPRRTRS